MIYLYLPIDIEEWRTKLLTTCNGHGLGVLNHRGKLFLGCGEFVPWFPPRAFGQSREEVQLVRPEDIRHTSALPGCLKRNFYKVVPPQVISWFIIPIKYRYN